MGMYRMAGLTVSMSPRFALTRNRAEKYRVDSESADIVLTAEGTQTEEYALLAKMLYEQLPYFDAFLLHASAVELDGRAYAFSAASGTGKSTHTAFWQQEFGAKIINDDKPILRVIDGAFCACGTPFSGKHDKSRNVCVPLAGIAFLHRAAETTIERMSSREALWSLLNQTLRPDDPDAYDRLLSLLESLLTTVPIYRLGCTNDPSAATIARKAMQSYASFL